MDKDWVSIFSTSEEFQAEIAKGVLEENEIECVMINKKDSFYHFGEIELYVMREDVVKSKYLLKDF